MTFGMQAWLAVAVAAGAMLGWQAADGVSPVSTVAAAGGEIVAAGSYATPGGRRVSIRSVAGGAREANRAAAGIAAQAQQGRKPNILVIFGDDIGVPQISAYTMGLMGYQTPNIDRIAKEGMIFTDAYGQQSCTAGRASFILGQEPFRTGLLTIGMPGDPHGITDWMPTIADVLKTQGYATGQFGKNHLGDQDQHLPTRHGFDEFFGNLYHLNAEEEPEGYFYPKDPAFRKSFGPRGVMHAHADGRIQDTGPLNTKRMPTVDEEFLGAAKTFITAKAKANTPFFVWFNTTRMHIFTHLKPSSLGKTGKGIHADGMVEHDASVGELLNLLDELKVADNTIVLYTTDNGAELALWPDGAMTMFRGEKGTTWEGGFRIPMMVRWPGVVKPGSVSNEIISLLDWFPTLAEVAGAGDIKAKMRTGFQAGNKTFKVHLDGYNFAPYLRGQSATGPRDVIYYFDQGGNLNAVRWNDWKVSFATASHGNIATATREVPSWALITNLRMDPYERGLEDGGGAIDFFARQMWLLVPIQAKIKDLFQDFDQFPFQTGSTLNPSGIGYGTLRQQDAMKRLKELEGLRPR